MIWRHCRFLIKENGLKQKQNIKNKEIAMQKLEIALINNDDV